MAQRFFYVSGGAFFLVGIVWFAVDLVRDPFVGVTVDPSMTVAVTRNGRAAMWAGREWLSLAAIRPTKPLIKVKPQEEGR